jgi:DNA-binding SARP family transcriptional activator
MLRLCRSGVMQNQNETLRCWSGAPGKTGERIPPDFRARHVGQATAFRLLGPIEVVTAGQRLDIGRPRQRCVLAALLVDANRVVPASALIDRVWGDDPPATVRNALYSYLARLRPVVAAAGGRVARTSGGYLLELDRDALDIHRFRALVAEATAQSSAPDRSIALLAGALGLWHGTPFGDLRTPWIDGMRATLLAERRSALLRRSELLLRQGRSGEIVADLREAAASDPYDERLAEQLMLALYRCGQRAGALAYYQHMRRGLAEQIGVDPGPELQRLHQQILRGEPVPAAGRPRTTGPNPVPAQLPHDIPWFTGRATLLAELDDLLAPEAGGYGAPAVMISAIEGAAGVGKTALGIRVAHRLSPRFPDGQLYVDLRGYDAQQPPMSPVAALGQFLRALGVAPRSLPVNLDELAALYRSTLAGRRVLVVLDNAATPEQARPLLPGTPAARAIVTSRNQLEGLVVRDGAHRIVLDVLSPGEAAALLTRVIGKRRAAAEPAAAGELARLCARLPLALRVAAERVASQPGAPLAPLIAQLADERDRLDALATSDDESAAIRAALSWSYRGLPAAAARAFRLLGLHTGPDISLGAAAALTGTTPGETRRLLAALTRVHLLEENQPDRFSFHDLLRVYAAERCRDTESCGEREIAVDRVLGWYVSSATAADTALGPHRRRDHLYPRGGQATTAVFVTHRAALDWCEAERSNLVAAVRDASAAGRPAAWQLPVILGSFFNLRKHWLDWIATHQAGLSAARQAGDRRGEAWVRTGLGLAYWDLRRGEEAIGHYEHALKLHHELGDRLGEAATLNNLGIAFGDLRRFADAARCLEDALAICRELGDRSGEGMTLDSLGVAYKDLGRLHDAIGCLSAAVAACRDTGNQRGEGFALDNLGDVYREMRRQETAAEHYERALVIRQDIGDRQGEANTLGKLGDLRHEIGQPDLAADYWRRALKLLQERGGPGAERIATRLDELYSPRP